MDMLEGLNPEQLAAASHTDGPLLVVAGAGTGKTRVITHRIAQLIASGKAKPGQVLALTFTEKAAHEMSDRLYDLIGWQSLSVPVRTFNAFGAELLGRYGSHIGRSVRGGLVNDTQKALLLQQHMPEIELEYYGVQPDSYAFAGQLVGYIGRLQNAGISPERYRKFVDELVADPGERHPADVLEQRDLASVYELYERIKQATGTFDYFDQVALPLQILNQRPNLAERLRREYSYVLVDEYQDTSPIQDELLRAFVPADGNLFAVGDDDQSIYSFRGADISNILRFTEHFKVAAPVALVQNYRSGQPILDAAYRLIRHNDPDRLEVMLGLNKQLSAQSEAGIVTFTPYLVPTDELAGVVELIAGRIAAGEPASEMAVLSRSNALLRKYAKALRVREIPFAISTQVNVFEQRELINLWYLMQWLGQRASDEAITHVVLGPFIGWTAAQLRLVVERSSNDLSGFEAALRALGEEGDAASQQLVTRLDTWREWALTETATRLAFRLVFEAPAGQDQSLSERLQAGAHGSSEEAHAMRVFEDLHRLLGQMDDVTTIADLAGEDTTLSGYLNKFPEPPQIDSNETLGDASGVQLLTVHASKGLEFDVVYVVNCTAKAWSPQPPRGLQIPPELRDESNLPEVHEQRRLLYVAVTRARRELILSAPSETPGGQRNTVSPLITELLGDAPAAAIRQSSVDKTDKLLQKLQQFYPLKSELPAKLSFETADGWIELGVGALGLYDRSPHDFFLEYVLKIHQPFGPQLAFGTAVHGAIQAFYEAQLRNETVPLAELEARLDELWSDRGYDTKEQAEQARKRAHHTIQRFVTREQDRPKSVEATELPIRLEVPEVKLRLRGRIDATFRSNDGLEVRDFKTGGLFDAEKIADMAKKSFQLRTYALAIEQLTGTPPDRVTLDYVVTGTEGTAQLTPRLLANHREKLIKLTNQLRAGDFAPGTPSEFNPSAALRYYGTQEDEGEA